MASMAMNILNDVCNLIRSTGSYDLVVTTGECVRKMDVKDQNIDEEALYLVHTDRSQVGGKVRSYYRLQFSEDEIEMAKKKLTN